MRPTETVINGWILLKSKSSSSYSQGPILINIILSHHNDNKIKYIFVTPMYSNICGHMLTKYNGGRWSSYRCRYRFMQVKRLMNTLAITF
jgi:hypothetical protein